MDDGEEPGREQRDRARYVSFSSSCQTNDDQVCGRVVYTDLHVGAGDQTGQPFHGRLQRGQAHAAAESSSSCSFDLSSCVQRDDQREVTQVDPPRSNAATVAYEALPLGIGSEFVKGREGRRLA